MQNTTIAGDEENKTIKDGDIAPWKDLQKNWTKKKEKDKEKTISWYGEDRQALAFSLHRPSRLWRSGRAYVEYVADMKVAETLGTSTEALLTYTDSRRTSTGSLLTTTDALPTITDFYWLFTDFYWFSTDSLLTSTNSLLTSTDSLLTSTDSLLSTIDSLLTSTDSTDFY